MTIVSAAGGAPWSAHDEGVDARLRPTTSARSLLITILGEFAYPRSGEAWTATLVDALGAMGVEHKSARQALSRAAQEGLLTATRYGRRVRWTLTPAGDDLLRLGTERIYGFLRTPGRWDGQWLLVSAPIPAAERLLRHRLRTRLSWLGMGSPSPGLWVVPNTQKAPEVQAVLEELGLADRAFAWAGHVVGEADVTRLIGTAWDLAELAARYADFIARFTAPATEVRDPFVDQVNLIQEWRRFPFLDPDLPPELLSDDWPGARAADTFHDRHERWDGGAQAAWERMETDAAARL